MPRGLQEVLAPRISRRLAHEGCGFHVHTPATFTPRRYSFLLEAESTPGPYCGRKDLGNEKSERLHRD